MDTGYQINIRFFYPQKCSAFLGQKIALQFLSRKFDDYIVTRFRKAVLFYNASHNILEMGHFQDARKFSISDTPRAWKLPRNFRQLENYIFKSLARRYGEL
jgi:hypothetical protein